MAVSYLKEAGMAILERNFRVRGAEVDIVAQDGDVTVFVEVKSRRSLKKGWPGESVNAAKQRKIRLGALHYLKKMKLAGNARIRFDVIEILEGEGEADIRLVKNAFAPDGDGF